jgi:hypothetical protein
MRTLRFTLLPLLLVACTDQEPVAPDANVTPLFSATSTWTYASLFLDFVYTDGVNTCVGEGWHGYGEVPYRMHEVSNGSGGYSYHIQFLPTTPWGPQYSLTGLTSGTVWWLKNGGGLYNESFHINKGQVYRYKYHETYKSEDGDKLFNDGSMHLTVNANGELVVERLEYLGLRCDKRN